LFLWVIFIKQSEKKGLLLKVKKQEFEKEVREAEVSCKKQELEIERIKAETL
jgi:hypothetical protein